MRSLVIEDEPQIAAYLGRLLGQLRATNSAIRSLPPDCSRTYTTRRLDRTKVMTE
jgi:hypothetical protein